MPRSTHFDLGSSGYLGFLLMKMGQVEEGQSILDEAVFHYRQTGNPRAISAMYTFLGGVLIQQEKYHEAKPLLLEALAFQEKIDDWIYMKMALAWLGEVYEELGDYPQATAYYEKSLAVSQGNGDRLGIAVASGHLGRVSLALNKPQQAERYLADALSLARQIQFMPVIIDGLISVATLLAHKGDKQRALEILIPTLNHPAGEPRMRARAEYCLAGLTDTPVAEILAQSETMETLEAVVAGLFAADSF